VFGPCIKCVVLLRSRRGKRSGPGALDTLGLNAEEALAAFDASQEEKKEADRRAKRAAAAAAAAAAASPANGVNSAAAVTVTVFGRPVGLDGPERTSGSARASVCGMGSPYSGLFAEARPRTPARVEGLQGTETGFLWYPVNMARGCHRTGSLPTFVGHALRTVTPACLQPRPTLGLEVVV
jgi:hypothetical protein